MEKTTKVENFYMAHPFELRRTVRKWELRMESKYNINLDNPFYDHTRSDIDNLDALKENSKAQKEYFRQRNTPETINRIVDGDLKSIRQSDGLIAYLDKKGIGTPMEIFFAARILHIPVYIITKKFTYHPWIMKYATKIFPHRTAFEQFIKKEFGLKQGL